MGTDAGFGDFLPASSARNENSTAPIHPAVMSPLLIWAMRFIDDFAEDILGAWREHQRLTSQIRNDFDAAAAGRLGALIEHHAAEGRPLPGQPDKNGNYIADRYLAALAGANPRQVKHFSGKYGAGLPVSAEAPLATGIGGRLHGQPWLPHINFHDAPKLMVRLAAAAMIIVLYLSGMRAGEGLELKAGAEQIPLNVAWHIARLPGGRIALATQYGHLRASAVTDGYSGRARQGLRRVLDIETARSMADYLDDLAERINGGEGVSGPAAQRMIKAARDAAVRFEGMFLTPKQAGALLDEPQFNVYDNPAAFLSCNYDPAKALCHPQRPGNSRRDLPPGIDRCDPACANIARTDAHITRLRTEIAPAWRGDRQPAHAHPAAGTAQAAPHRLAGGRQPASAHPDHADPDRHRPGEPR